MRFAQSILFCAGAAFISVGCEVHSEPAQVAASGDVVVDEPQGQVVDAPGVVAIDTEPDPAQRQYIYDEGYPPGTYLYDNYYYYGGYRYPRDVFVNQYVQENIRRHRFVNRDENRRQAQGIEQRHRTEFAKTRGVRQNRPANPTVQKHEQTPIHQPESPRPNVERPNVERPNVRPNGDHVERPNPERPNTVQPENRVPANEEHRGTVEHPENRGPAQEEHRPAPEHPENKVNPAKENHEGAGEPKHEEGK